MYGKKDRMFIGHTHEGMAAWRSRFREGGKAVPIFFSQPVPLEESGVLFYFSTVRLNKDARILP